MAGIKPPSSRVVTGTFTRAGVASDPDDLTVTFGRVKPSGDTPTELVYGTDPEVIKDGTGVYSVEVDCTSKGTWACKMKATWTSGVSQPTYKTVEEEWVVDKTYFPEA